MARFPLTLSGSFRPARARGLRCAVAAALFAIGGCVGTGDEVTGALHDIGESLTGDAQVLAGLRDVLSQSANVAVQDLGQYDGYWGAEATRIPLPPFLLRYDNAMRAIGYGENLDAFHLAINRAAEAALPQTAGALVDAIVGIAPSDPRDLLDGGPSAATTYFRRACAAPLAVTIRPIVEGANYDVGASPLYKRVADRAGPILRLSGSEPPPDIDDYVAQKMLAVLFVRMGEEEARIRADPSARSTEPMRRMFALRKAAAPPAVPPPP